MEEEAEVPGEEEVTRTMLRVFVLVVALGQLQVTTRSVVQSVYRLHLASHVGFLVLVPADANVDSPQFSSGFVMTPARYF